MVTQYIQPGLWVLVLYYNDKSKSYGTRAVSAGTPAGAAAASCTDVSGHFQMGAAAHSVRVGVGMTQRLLGWGGLTRRRGAVLTRLLGEAELLQLVGVRHLV